MGNLNKFNLKEFITKYNSNVFVETGTWTGDGVNHASSFNFEKLFSIELVEELYLKAEQRFINNNKIKIFHNNSCDGLKYILENFVKEDDKIIFWLDAHLPQFYTKNIDDRYDVNTKILIPLEEELKIIKNYKNISNDVFLIDDLRIYEEGPYAHGNWYDVVNSKLYTQGIKFIEDLINTTHTITKNYEDE
jgi:hypothetical protein